MQELRCIKLSVEKCITKFCATGIAPHIEAVGNGDDHLFEDNFFIAAFIDDAASS